MLTCGYRPSHAACRSSVDRASLPPGSDLELGVRPENVIVTKEAPGSIEAVADLVERLGERTLVYARLSDGTLITAHDGGNSKVQARLVAAGVISPKHRRLLEQGARLTIQIVFVD